ncbi:MAG: zf-HC2 domain-containing protein [Gemmatimonadales bacterium]|nr:MAG: zf-HC2 domain-containing protein [Gemmatimonadales bacterium]
MNHEREGRDKAIGCERVREHLPLRLSGVHPSGASEVPDADLDAHLADCAECTDELAFLELLSASRPSPPAHLAARVVARALGSRPLASGPAGVDDPDVVPFRASRRAPQWSRWWANPAAAAAVLVLAVGMGLVARGGTPGQDGGTVLAAFDAQSAELWAEDWLVAGAPYLDGVSDETLALLVAGIDP